MRVFRIGMTTAGAVRAAHGEHIHTRFFVLGGPLLPVGSEFACDDGRTLKVRMNATSVLAGYARWYGLVGGLGCSIIGWMTLLDEDTVHPELGMPLLGAGVALLGLFALSVLLMGRCSAREIWQRGVLKSVMGYGLLPSMVSLGSARKEFTDLGRMLERKGLPKECGGLTDVDFEDDDAPLVYAAALYGKRVQPRSDWDDVLALAEHGLVGWVYRSGPIQGPARGKKATRSRSRRRG